MKKRFLAVILALALCVGLAPAAFAAEEGEFEDFVELWVMPDMHTYALERYQGPGGDVVIPEHFKSVMNSAFKNCTTLTSLTIPSSVTSIDLGTFEGCINLKNIYVDPENEYYKSLDGLLLSKDGALLIYPLGRRTASELNIPDGITEIGSSTFQNWKNLTSVTIPNSVTSIGGIRGDSGAFEGCTSLTSVTIPDSVTFLGGDTFRGCTNLTSVTLPTNCRAWGFGAFSGTNLKDVYYAGSEFQLCNSFIYGDLSAEKCSGLGDWLWQLCYGDNVPDSSIFHFGKATIEPLVKFTDLKPDGYYLDAVKWAVNLDITTGKTDTTFAPGLKCSHSEILTFLWRAAGKPESSAQPPIAMKGDEFYYKAVKWAAEKGMIGGDFDPKAGCTRADAVNYIWQAFGKPAAAYDGRFTDVPAGSPYATAVAWALANEVTTGATATTFSPAKICNRGEIVTFLYRAYK